MFYSYIVIRLFLLYVKFRLWYAIYVVLESASDATFSIRYSKESDRFTINDASGLPVFDPARFDLGTSDDFILFDNERPGALREITHGALNQFAVETLARTIFDINYPFFCESLREGARLYDTPERSGQMTVPFTNAQRLGRIALHAKAAGASPAVIAFHQRIVQLTNANLNDERSHEQS